MAELTFEPDFTPEMWREYELKRAKLIVENPGFDPEKDSFIMSKNSEKKSNS